MIDEQNMSVEDIITDNLHTLRADLYHKLKKTHGISLRELCKLFNEGVLKFVEAPIIKTKEEAITKCRSILSSVDVLHKKAKGANIDNRIEIANKAIKLLGFAEGIIWTDITND